MKTLLPRQTLPPKVATTRRHDPVLARYTGGYHEYRRCATTAVCTLPTWLEEQLLDDTS